MMMLMMNFIYCIRIILEGSCKIGHPNIPGEPKHSNHRLSIFYSQGSRLHARSNTRTLSRLRAGPVTRCVPVLCPPAPLGCYGMEIHLRDDVSPPLPNLDSQAPPPPLPAGTPAPSHSPSTMQFFAPSPPSRDPTTLR